MKVEVDEEAGAAYITLLPREIEEGEAHYSIRVTGDVVMDFDRQGHPIGIEILDLEYLHPEVSP